MADKTTDEIVDERVRLLSDSLELKLTKELENRFTARAEANRKTLTWAVGSVTLVLTLLGIKTFGDMQNVAKTSATEAVKQRLSLDDPNSEIRRDIDNILAKAIIDSKMLELAKPADEDGFPSDVTLSDRDADRVGRFILETKTKPDDFRDGLDLLLRAGDGAENSERQYVADIKKLLSDPQSWLVRQPDKVASILHLISDDSVQDYSRRVLQQANPNKKLLAGAIEYSTKTNDLQAIPLLEKLAGSPDRRLAADALTAVASLQPASVAVGAAVSASVDPEDLDSARNTLRIAGGLAKPSRRSILMVDPQRKLRIQLIARAIQKTIDADYVFRAADFGFRRRDFGYGVSSRQRLGRTSSIGKDLFGGVGLEAAALVLQQNSASPAQFEKALTALCVLDGANSCRAAVRVRLGQGALMILRGAPPLDAAGTPDGIAIDFSESGGVRRPIAIWKDQTGAPRNAPLIGISNGAKAEFKLTLRKPEPDSA